MSTAQNEVDICMDLMESETKRMILLLCEKSHSISSRVLIMYSLISPLIDFSVITNHRYCNAR